MSRILKAYQTRFHWLLRQVHARRIDQGVEWLVNQAQRLSREQKITLADALTHFYDDIASRPAFRLPPPAALPDLFYCDAGLGGLARWLRAAGYDSRWKAGIDDDELLREAHRISAVLLTTDSMLMERRVLRDRLIPSFWLPPTLSVAEQLHSVFREFSLKVRPPRCMSCGGLLRRESKENLGKRIPPRTYRWLDEYFVCSRCGKLFWHGTHWQKIRHTLETLPGEPARSH